VENLYFDTVQFLYHLALAILVGGGVVLGAVVAPAVLQTMSSEGGTRGLFPARWDGLAILAVIVVVITSVLKIGFEITGAPEPRLVARWVALFFLSAAVIYSSGWANPVARSLRSQTPAFDDLPESTAVRREFAKLHASSSRAMRLGIVAGLVALLLS